MSNVTQSPVLRFAPSPNGRLHLGHAYSALYSQATAERLGGTLLLRIEDIDLGRCRPEFIDGIYEDLAWLGLTWPLPVRRQSEHFNDYEAALKTLRDMDLVYPCFATRRDIQTAIEESGIGLDRWPRDPDGAPIYPGLYKDLPPRERDRRLWEGQSYAWRLDMDKALTRAEEIHGGALTFRELEEGPQGQHGLIPVKPEQFGDVIIARKDVPTSYHLAVTVDDALQGVTHVTRGQDLFHATFIQRILQVLLGLPEPLYFHHPLIRDEDGRRLSKRAKDQGICELRLSGKSPDDIRRLIGL